MKLNTKSAFRFKDNNENRKYIVMQVKLQEAVFGTGSARTTIAELEDVLNEQVEKGYKLHTMSTSKGGKGMLGGDHIFATLVFERID